MLTMTLRVVRKDGSSSDYSMTPKVVVLFERQFGKGVGRAFQEEQRAEHLYWLAWKSEHEAGKAVKPFDGWLDDIVDVQMIEDDAAPLTSEG